MESLPSSIEAYLQEAGFSGTEIVILKKLLEEDALTLRELASKTGKSTGVLDQAVKKLMKKKILNRETINDTPKYVLVSLQSVLQWMEEDMRIKQQMMVRRHESFELFIKSISSEKKRPEMEYFEGSEGLKRAYNLLLEQGNDIVQYGPTLYLAEEDPLRDFRVQWFRERRNRGIFSRVLTHDTPLGRRFQSRDVFEYRKTIVLDPDAYPFNFEKIIIGDTVACFQLEEEIACFIKYPELAANERQFFERLWNKKIENQRANQSDIQKADVVIEKPVVSLKTRVMSQMREFFLSRRSVTAFALFGVLSAAISLLIFNYNNQLNLSRMQERVRSIAATASVQFDAQDIEQIHTLQDISKPEYAKLVYQLNQIRNQNEGVKYAYIMRHKNASIWEFIADADAIDPYAVIDVNSDGELTEVDELSYPGMQYDTVDFEAETIESLSKPIAYGVDADQWGEVVSGWAPIKNESGETVAIIGVDILVTDIASLTNKSFSFVYYFLGIFVLFIAIRLAAFNRSIFNELLNLFNKRHNTLILILIGLIAVSASVYLYMSKTILLNQTVEISAAMPLALYAFGLLAFFIFGLPGFKSSLFIDFWKICMSKKVLTVAILILMCIYWVTFGFYVYTVRILKEETGKRLMSIAITAASQIDPNDLTNLRKASDMKTPEYQKVFRQLNEIRDQNPELTFIYIMRPTKEVGIWEFVVDADSNYYIPDFYDMNQDYQIDESDENVAPGVRYDAGYSYPILLGKGLKEATFDEGLVDQWGQSMSASAPIFIENKLVAVVSIDKDISNLLDNGNLNLIRKLLITSLMSLLFLGYLFFKPQKLLYFI